jgi:hypothetical protein
MVTHQILLVELLPRQRAQCRRCGALLLEDDKRLSATVVVFFGDNVDTATQHKNNINAEAPPPQLSNSAKSHLHSSIWVEERVQLGPKLWNVSSAARRLQLD